MNEELKHLDVEQIERLMRARSEEKPGVPVAEGLEDAQRHLMSCGFCQKLIAMERENDQILRGLRVDFSAGSSSDCPSEIQLCDLVGGLTGEKEAEKLLAHASECEHCGPVLRRATEELRPERTADEESKIECLATSQPAWQEAFAKKLASAAKITSFETKKDTAGSSEKQMSSNWHWLYGVAAAAAIIATLAVGIEWRLRPAHVQSLLAEAYTLHRTMELRIPGAKYAPLPAVTRGEADESQIKKPVPLLEAEEVIAKRLSRNPTEVDWLQAKVQADLLEGSYKSAIETAKEALQSNPKSSSLLRDLGSAYFLQAEREPSTSDLATAYQLLSQSLALSPDDPVSLFNRAVVAQRLQLYSQAEEDWGHYLRVETNSEWLADGRERLEKVRQILQEQKNRSTKNLASAEEVASAIASGEEERVLKIDSSIEAYQRVALEHWIPELVSSRNIGNSYQDSLEFALRELSRELGARHNDQWLSELLSNRSFRSGSKAMTLLVAAIQANATGQHTNAMQMAASAEREFQNEGDEPGRIRAAFEEIYANHLAARGKPCHEKAKRLLEDLRGRNYSWIETQTWLEAAACGAEISRVDESLEDVIKAVELAKSAKYTELELRTSVFAADLTTDTAKRFDLLTEGLKTFWKESDEPMRGYSLYAVLDTTADDLQLWFLDEAVIKQGLQLVVDDPDLALRGTEQYRLARAQLALGKTEESQVNFAKARDLLERSHSKDLTTSITVDLAEAYVLSGRYGDALQLLDSVEQSLSELSHDIVTARFYSARAVALLGVGRTADAENTLDLSQSLARRGIDSISSERDRFEWVQGFSPTYKSLAHIKFASDPEASFYWWQSFRGASLSGANGHRHVSKSTELDLPQFPNWLSEGTVLVSYVAFIDGIGVWVYDGTHVRNQLVQTSMPELEVRLQRFLDNCERPSSQLSSLSVQGRELYNLLLKPIDRLLSGKRKLIFELDDVFGAVPFEALVNDEGKYLAETRDIEYAPGLFYLSEKGRPEQVSSASRALVIGISHSDAQSQLSSLPETLDEARAIAGRFDTPKLLLEQNAIFEKVRDALPDAEVFHFAGHAIASRHRNVLILEDSVTDDGIHSLGPSDFNSRALAHARLVVLSACSTASGIASKINDRDSLARNALASGVPNVVASRWLVDSAAARAWMSTFYEEILNGKSTGDAARRASLLLSAQPQWRHPYYWATFTVFV